jgi:hypothetical protein
MTFDMADLMGIRLPFLHASNVTHAMHERRQQSALTPLAEATRDLSHSSSHIDLEHTPDYQPSLTAASLPSPNITSASCSDVAESDRRARLERRSYTHTLDASMQGPNAAARLHRKNHVTDCRATAYTLQQRHPFLLAVVLASIAGRASRPHHVADQSVPPSSFTSAARRKSQASKDQPQSLTRSRPPPCKGARVEE